MLTRLILAFALLSSVPAAAIACMNAWHIEGDEAVKRIAKAEKLLEQGKLSKARRAIEPRRYRFSDPGHKRRAMLVLSAIEFRKKNASSADYFVQNFIAGLEDALERDKDNPVLQARLAEGYALDHKTADKALTILDDLSSRDLMPDAYGFRNLALLLAAGDDMKAAKQALKSCKAMTKRKSVCTLAAVPGEAVAKAPALRSKKSRARK
jgi:hypothetical protein